MSQARRDLITAEVARLLREARERKDLSMTRLAAKAGLSLSIISFLERGLRNPTLETLLRVTEVLDIDLSKVLEKAEKRAAVKAKARSKNQA